MTQPDALQRVRQTAAARVIGRAWQHVRVAIQVSGTACLALRRYDKAAAKEKESMWTRLARVGPIMLDHRDLKARRAAWIKKHRGHKDKAVRKNPPWADSDFARKALRVLGHGESVLVGDALQELLTAYANGVKSFPTYCDFLNKRGAKEKWVASTRRDDFSVFNFVLRKFIAESPQYAGEDGHHAPGFKDAFVAYGLSKYPNASRQSLLDMNCAEKKKLADGAPEEKEERVVVEQAASAQAASALVDTAGAATAEAAAALSEEKIAEEVKRRVASAREAVRAAERHKAAEEQAARDAAHSQQLEAKEAEIRAAARLLEERAAADRAKAEKAEADRATARERAARLQAELDAATAARAEEEESRAANASGEDRADPSAAEAIQQLRARLAEVESEQQDRKAAFDERLAAMARAQTETEERLDEARRELDEERRRALGVTAEDPLDGLAARVGEALDSEKPNRPELKGLISELRDAGVDGFQATDIKLNDKTDVWEEALMTWYETWCAARGAASTPPYADDPRIAYTSDKQPLSITEMGCDDDLPEHIVVAQIESEFVVLKRAKDDSGLAGLVKEARALQALQSCPSVLTLACDDLVDWRGDRWLVTRRADGTLVDALAEYKNDLCGLNLVYGPVLALLCAMEHVHYMGWAWMDIKPQNVLWTKHGHPGLVNDSWQLGDADIAEEMTNDDQLTYRGNCTVNFAPPVGELGTTFNGAKFDVYCTGMTIVSMILAVGRAKGSEETAESIDCQLAFAGVEEERRDDETSLNFHTRLDAEQRETLMNSRSELLTKAVVLVSNDDFIKILGDLAGSMLEASENLRVTAADATKLLHGEIVAFLMDQGTEMTPPPTLDPVAPDE